jgi:SAM-dependent methyltransferase
MTTFKDHFSGHADAYAQARPTYPEALFDWLALQCPRRELAWDAGCGNSQAALALAARFAHVVATDPSAMQIAQAPKHPVIDYRVEPAESPSLADASVDLVTVAQAYHWFDPLAFIAAVGRVARPSAVVAIWSYGSSSVDKNVDAVFMTLYEGILGRDWPPERRHIENGYADLPFPFEPLPTPMFAMTLAWTLPQYLAYLRSWSASERHRISTGDDAVTKIETAMTKAWGDPAVARNVSWPLNLHAGRIC